MSKYLTRVQYFEALAVSDPNIQHTAAYTEDGSAKTRKSFIREAMNDDGLSASIVSELNFPVCIFSDFSIKLDDNVGEINERIPVRLIFLHRVMVTDNQPLQSVAAEQAKDHALMIATKWINKIYHDLEEGISDVLRGIDMNSVSIDEYPTPGENIFGWQLSFSTQRVAAEIIEYDSNYWQ